MIKIIKKTTDTPAILKGQGAAETKALKSMTKAEIVSYKFKSSIYGGKTVKDKLKKIQYNKCCFCESVVTAISHGDVEHYRPKGGWIQNDGDPLTQPGYYWLAYDFSNLFLSCQICNQTYKKNYFPLASPGKRAKSPRTKISSEKPLIIDPGKEEPSKYLKFNKEIIVAKNDHQKGVETISRTGLNRADLVSARFTAFKMVEALAFVAKLNLPISKDYQKQVKALANVDQQFSLMIKSNFPDLV